MLRKVLFLLLVAGTLVAAKGAQAAAVELEQIVAAVEEARRAGEYQRAGQLVDEALASGGPGGAPLAYGTLLRLRGRVLLDLDRHDEAEDATAQALAVLEPLAPTLEQARAFMQMALVHRFRAEYAEALPWVRRAERLFLAFGDEEGLRGAYNLYGVIYDFLGQFEESLKWHHRSLTLARALDRRSGIADALYAIGEAYRALGEHDRALTYFQDALTLDEESGVVRSIAFSHTKLGVTHLEMGDLGKARSHLERAFALFQEMEAPRDRQWAVANLAELAVAEGAIEEPRAALEGVLAAATQNGWPVLVNQTRVALAELEAAAGRPQLAIQYLEQALSTALEQGSRRRALGIYRLQVKILESLGRYEEALGALRRQYDLELELFSNLRASAIGAIQGEAEFQRQAVALRLAEKEAAVTELALQRAATLRAVGLVSLLVLFVIAFLVYGRVVARRQNRRLQEEVAQKTRALQERHDELERAYEAVDRASLTDPLTGLYNRRFLERHIEADEARSLRLHQDSAMQRPRRPDAADLVFFLVDLDHFKAVNDRAGHAAGDAVLVQVGRLLEREFRKGDFIVRWGGEEFLVVARFINRSTASAIAERVRRTIESCRFDVGSGEVLRCTCSIGFAAFPLSPENPEAGGWRDVFDLADHALYAVKHGPRNGWAGYLSVPPETAAQVATGNGPVTRFPGAIKSVRSFTDTWKQGESGR